MFGISSVTKLFFPMSYFSLSKIIPLYETSSAGGTKAPRIDLRPTFSARALGQGYHSSAVPGYSLGPILTDGARENKSYRSRMVKQVRPQPRVSPVLAPRPALHFGPSDSFGLPGPYFLYDQTRQSLRSGR